MRVHLRKVRPVAAGEEPRNLRAQAPEVQHPALARRNQAVRNHPRKLLVAQQSRIVLDDELLFEQNSTNFESPYLMIFKACPQAVINLILGMIEDFNTEHLLQTSLANLNIIHCLLQNKQVNDGQKLQIVQ